MDYILYNKKRKKAVKYKDIKHYKESSVFKELLNRVIVVGYPIEAFCILEKYFKADEGEYIIFEINSDRKKNGN